MKLKYLGLVLASAISLASVTIQPAAGAPDVTPPAWSKPPTNSMKLGAQVNPAILGPCDSWSIPVQITWAARDPESGISHYGYSGYDSGSEDATIISSTSLTRTAWVEDDVCGGGGSDLNFYAWNGAGLHAAWAWSDQGLTVVQEDSLTQSLSLPWAAYNGRWSASACNCWSGGTTQKTTQSGASMVLSLPYSPFGEEQESYGVGLVMAKGPDRGKTAIFVDNVKVATVDTYSSSKVNRTVVWRQSVTKYPHTIKVVNLGTSGRTRIDVDAFVLLRKVGGGPLDPNLY